MKENRYLSSIIPRARRRENTREMEGEKEERMRGNTSSSFPPHHYRGEEGRGGEWLALPLLLLFSGASVREKLREKKGEVDSPAHRVYGERGKRRAAVRRRVLGRGPRPRSKRGPGEKKWGGRKKGERSSTTAITSLSRARKER